jgi:hypothetical protein
MDIQIGEIMLSNFPIVGSYNIERHIQLDAQDTVNLYPIFDKEDKKPTALVQTPGLGSPRLLNSNGSNTRQSFVYRGSWYIVSNRNIYKVDSLNISTQINSGNLLNTSTGFVGIAANQKEIIFVDGVNGWLYNPTTTVFSQITDVNFPTKPIAVAYQDGYFIVPFGGTNKFAISQINDGSIWAPDQFAFFQSRPDVITAISDLHRRLFIFGDISTEVWLDAGEADFPFRRDNNLLLEYGCASPASVAQGYQRLFFLSADENGIGSVMMVDGVQPAPISNDIDITIQKMINPRDCQGFVYKLNKSVFYQLNFTTDNITFVFNVQTGVWHRLEMLDGSRHIAQWHAFFNNKHYVGAYNSPQYFEFSDIYNTNSYWTNDPLSFIKEESIHRYRVSHHLVDESYNKLRVDKLRIDVLPGQGLPNTNDEVPLIFLNVSYNGGVNYIYSKKASMGIEGDWIKKVEFVNLGVADSFLFKLETWTKSNFMIMGASIAYEVMPE